MSNSRIYVSFDRFNNGWNKASHLAPSGRTVTLTVIEICEKLNLEFETVHTMLKKIVNCEKK